MFVVVFDLAVLTAAAAAPATTGFGAEADTKLGGGGCGEYDDVPLVHLVQFGLLADATPPCGGCCACSAGGDEGGGLLYEDGGWYEGEGSGGSGWYRDDATAAAAARDSAAVPTVCVALFSVTMALVCLSSV